MTEPSSKQPLAPMDFSTFLLSLGSSAMINLGKMPDPEAPDGTTPKVNLEAAKQVIDIIGMLQEKTKGNLTEAENQLVNSLLYDLRVTYVDAQKAASGETDFTDKPSS